MNGQANMKRLDQADMRNINGGECLAVDIEITYMLRASNMLHVVLNDVRCRQGFMHR